MMKSPYFVTAMAVLALGLGVRPPSTRAENRTSLPRLTATIPLADVAGRIDHFALDAKGEKLFVAALGNGTLEVIDLERGARVAEMRGLREPQGVLFVPEVARLFVTNGDGASVSVFKTRDLARIAQIRVRSDPDNVRLAAGQVWIGEGSGRQGALAAIDPSRDEILTEIGLDGHPEAFELEAKGPRIFVNVPAAQEIQVVDRENGKTVARWKVPHAGNFPMAFDERDGHLFAGCRRPARLLVVDSASGATVADVAAPRDVDDIFVDSARDRVYVSAGEGIVRVYSLDGSQPPRPIGDVATGAGARTSLFVAASHRLYVAVPSRAGTPAAIQVFDTGH